MSWLGVNLNDSLQNIKGQITSFTRDVLAEESLQENDCEVLVPQRRLRELETQIFIQREEVEKLRAKNVEAEDRFRALDFSHSQRNSSLQKQLFETEEELRQLKARSEEWGWDGTSESIEGTTDTTASSHYADRVSRLERQLLLEENEKHKEKIIALQNAYQAQPKLIKEKFAANETETKNEKKQHLEQTEGQHISEGEFVELQSELASLKGKYEAVCDEKQQLSSNLEELDAQHQLAIEQILKKKHQLSEELNLLKDSIKKSESEVLRLNELLESNQPKFNLDERSEEEHQTLLSLNKKIEDLVKENLALTQQLGSHNTTENKELQVTKSKLTESNVALSKLDTQCKEQVANICTLELTIKEETNGRKEAVAERDQLLEKLALLEERIHQIQSVENELAQCKEQLDEALKEQSVLKYKVSVKECELRENATLINQLKDNAISQEEQILKFEAVLEEKNNEHMNAFTRLKQQQEMTKIVIKDFESEKRALQSRIHELEEKTRQPSESNENRGYKEIIEQLLSRCNVQNFKELPVVFSELSSEVASLRCERDRLSEDLSATIQELRDAQDLNEALEVEKADTERECEDLRDQLEELQCGERQTPEGSLTPRSLPTIEEEELDANLNQQEAVAKGVVTSAEERNEERVGVEGKDELMERIHQLQSQVAALSEARQNLEMELTAAKDENINLEQKFLELNGQLGNLSNLEVEAVTLRNKNRSLIGQLNESQNHLMNCSHVEEEKNNLALQIQQMTNAMDRMNFDSSHMRFKEEEYYKEKHLLQDQLSSQNRTIHEYFHEIARLKILLNENNNTSFTESQSKFSKMQDELDKVKGLLIYKDDQIDQLRQGIEQIGEIFNLKQVDLRHIFVHIKQEYFSLKTKLSETEKELSELQEELHSTSKTDEEASFESSSEPTAEETSESDSKLEAIQWQLSEAENQIKELKRLNDCLLEENKDLKQIEIKLENTLSEKSKIEKELEEEINQNKSLLEEKNKISDQVTQFYSENQTLKNEIDKYSNGRELENLERENEKKNLETTLKLEISSLENNLSSKLAEIQCLEEQIKTLESSPASNYSSQIEIAAKENAEKQAKIDKYENEMELVFKEKQNLFQEIESVRNEVEELKLKNMKFKNENDSIKQEISELQSERQQMIIASTQKHQESVGYYNEIQRLTTLIQQESARSNSEKESLKVEVSKKEMALLECTEQCKVLNQKLIEYHNKIEKTEETLQQNSKKENEQQHLLEKLKLTQGEIKILQEDNTKNQELLRSVIKERDHLRMANSSFNSQYEEKCKEVVSLQEKEKHVSLENQRLKQHLVEVEETYTKEVVQSEQRESSLRQSLAKLHEKMASHSTLYSNTNQKTAAQLGSVQEQLSEAIHQRDEALQHLQVAEEASLQHQEALMRLQQVLQDFQKGQTRDIAVATEREKRKYEEEREKNLKLELELKKIKGKISDMEMSLSTTKAMREELQAKEDTVIALKSQVHSMQLAAKKNQEQVALLKSSTDGKVDKHVLRNLIVGYFATPSDKQREVLRIIAEVLDFSSEERTRSGIDLHPGSWLSSIANFLAPPPSNIRIASKVDVLDHSSLSQAFIRFLEEESTPRFKPTLPAVQMAEEASLKAQKKALTKAGAKINPFVSVSDVTSTTMGSSLFAASVPSSLPTLQPVSVPSTQGLETQNSEAIVMQSSTTPTFTGSSGLDDSLHVNYPPSPSVSPTLSSSEQVSTSKFLNNLLNFDGVHPESGHS